MGTSEIVETAVAGGIAMGMLGMGYRMMQPTAPIRKKKKKKKKSAWLVP